MIDIIKKCERCGKALTPCSFGWYCENPECDFEYGIELMRTEGLEKLSNAIQLNIGKPSYNFNDVVVHVGNLEGELKLITDYVNASLITIGKRNLLSSLSEYKKKRDKELSELKNEKQHEIDVLTRYKKQYELIKNKWWFKLFNIFGTHSITECMIMF